MSELKPYTEDELAEQQQLYDEVFMLVWESEGQYCRSGGGQYEKSFAWWAFKHQQSKVDELQKKLDEYIFIAESVDEMYEREVKKNNELQKRVDALSLALDKIAHPIPYMQKEADLNGCELNGYWAVKMSEDHTYSKDIARKALEKEQALKGEQP